jgi:phosphatidate phosphatase APP1
VSPALPDVEAEVTWEGATQPVRSDEWGYLSATFPVREPPPPLTWATLHCRQPDDGSAHGTRVPVYGPPRDARYVVVSDIDDTIIETELENPARRLAQLLGVSLRLPFEGIVELFQDFARAGNLICYLSNSSWRLQEPLAALFSEHGLPTGPLLLRQRGREGSTGRGESSAVTHKRDALLYLANRFSELEFILVGDSSREDPLRYIELAKAHPGRVLAIYIRSVAGSLAHFTDLPALERQAAELGVPFVVSERSADLKAHALKSGFIDPSEEQAA